MINTIPGTNSYSFVCDTDMNRSNLIFVFFMPCFAVFHKLKVKLLCY